jgi:tetratricopeptide (TPR) repeat protein
MPSPQGTCLIYFLATRGFADCVSAISENPAAPKITVLTYDDVLQRLSMARGTYVFTDIDRLSSGDLIRASRLYCRLAEGGCRVLNDPAEVKTRFALLRALHDSGENPINAYRVDEGVAPRRFPVFVRVADDHLDPLTDLIHDEATLARAIKAAVASGIPRSALIVIEYAAEPVRPGLYRKLSVFRLGDRYLPHVSVHDVSWQVKHGRLGVASADLYDEELAMMRSNPYADRLRRAFEIAGIEYGRADFGIVGGDVCVYEINTNPFIGRIRPHPFPQRVEAMTLWWSKLIEALEGLAPEETGAGEVTVKGPSVAALERAVGIFPALADGHTRLSREYEKRGNAGAALAAAEQAVATNPNDISALAQKAKLLADSKRTEEAIVIAREMMDLDPNRARTCYFLAGLLAQTGQPEEALAMARAAAELEPKNWRFQLRLSRMLKTAGDIAEALAAAERAFESAPEEAKVKEQLRALGHETPPRSTPSPSRRA